MANRGRMLVNVPAPHIYQITMKSCSVPYVTIIANLSHERKGVLRYWASARAMPRTLALLFASPFHPPEGRSLIEPPRQKGTGCAHGQFSKQLIKQ